MHLLCQNARLAILVHVSRIIIAYVFVSDGWKLQLYGEYISLYINTILLFIQLAVVCHVRPGLLARDVRPDQPLATERSASR